MIETNIIPQIAGRDADRLRGYTELLDFYQGRQWPGRERWGEKRLTFNYARVFIEKLTSYLMTGAGFIVEPVDNSPPARAAAEAAGEALRRVYEFNGLEQLDYETEIDCAVLGDACYKVVWDPASREVRVTSPDIQGIFVWWRGDDISDIRRVASRYQLSEEEALELYGEQINRRCGLDESGGGISSSLNALAVTGPGGRGEVGKGSVPFFQASSLTPAGRNSRYRTVVEVWTEKDFELYLDGALIERKPNPCGFIPFVIFPDRMSQNL